VYYRRGFYPRPGQADVPDDLWAEFQRIRGHLSNLDQNNVDGKTLSVERIVPPTDIDHNGVSDIVDRRGRFLYKETSVTSSIRNRNFSGTSSRWIDLGRYGLTLKTQSRGDSPWIVGASIDAVVYRRTDDVDVESDQSLSFTTGGVSVMMLGGPGNSDEGNADRANIRLRIRSSHGGISVAESVGGFNPYVFGCSIAVVAMVLAHGGPIEFSPVIQYRDIYRTGGHLSGGSMSDWVTDEDDGQAPTPVEGTPRWGCSIRRANIFAFGLYR
jgi:hypothetical protein